MDSLPSIGKLRWSCRRGTRELDVLVTYYLDHYYPEASLEEQKSFVRLLEFQDPELISWIMGYRNDYPDPGIAGIINLLSTVKCSNHKYNTSQLNVK